MALVSALYLRGYELPSHVLRTDRLCAHLLLFVGVQEVRALGVALRGAKSSIERALAGHRRVFYLCGGSDGRSTLRTAWGFDPELGSWQELAPLAQARSLATAVALLGHLYVCGGTDGKSFLASAERFLPGAQRWESLPPMPAPRGGAMGANLDNCLYLCGGRDGPRYLASVECFDPRAGEAGEWRPAPPMREARCYAAGGKLPGPPGRLYACGGLDHPRVLSSVECFEPDTGRWEKAPSLSAPRSYAAGVMAHGTLYLCGGSDGQSELNTVESYRQGSETWSAAPSLLHPRRHAAALAALGGAAAGQLLVFGGFDGKQYLRSIECFDPARGQWRTLEPLTPAPSALAAAATLDRL